MTPAHRAKPQAATRSLLHPLQDQVRDAQAETNLGNDVRLLRATGSNLNERRSQSAVALLGADADLVVLLQCLQFNGLAILHDAGSLRHCDGRLGFRALSA